MIKALLDTNILIDAIVPDRPFHDEALALMKAGSDDRLAIVIAATSLKDLYYILTKYLDEATARDAVDALMVIGTIASVDYALCRAALDGPEPDFEDAIILQASEVHRCDVLVTRDESAFRTSRVPVTSAPRLVELLGL